MEKAHRIWTWEATGLFVPPSEIDRIAREKRTFGRKVQMTDI